MDLKSKIKNAPFVKLLPCVIGGVLCSSLFVSDYALWLLIIALAVGLCALIHSKLNSLILCLSCFLFSFAMFQLQQAPKVVDAKRWNVIVEKQLTKGENYNTYSALLANYKRLEDTNWTNIQGKVLLISKDSLKLKTGEQLCLATKLNTDIYDSYKHKGYLGSMFVNHYNIKARSSIQKPNLNIKFAILQQKALTKLSKLRLKNQNQALASAMILGDRTKLDKTTKQAYSLSGSYHILAISGLHIGIIFTFINFILAPLILLPSGHRLLNILAVILIWFYAMMCGASASVCRAAFMFSSLQLAMFYSGTTHSLNILAGSAIIMIFLNTHCIYDVGFLMSYLAVFFIITCFTPIYSLVKTKYRWINIPLQLLIVSFIATACLSPLISMYFHRISFIGILISPIIIVITSMVLFFGIMWIILPLGFIQGGIKVIIDALLSSQNSLIDSVLNLNSHFDLSISPLICWFIYLIIIPLALLIWSKRNINKEVLL